MPTASILLNEAYSTVVGLNKDIFKLRNTFALKKLSKNKTAAKTYTRLCLHFTISFAAMENTKRRVNWSISKNGASHNNRSEIAKQLLSRWAVESLFHRFRLTFEQWKWSKTALTSQNEFELITTQKKIQTHNNAETVYYTHIKCIRWWTRQIN